MTTHSRNPPWGAHPTRVLTGNTPHPPPSWSTGRLVPKTFRAMPLWSGGTAAIPTITARSEESEPQRAPHERHAEHPVEGRCQEPDVARHGRARSGLSEDWVRKPFHLRPSRLAERLVGAH